MMGYPARAVTNEAGKTISGGGVYVGSKGETPGKHKRVKAYTFANSDAKTVLLHQLVDKPRTDFLARFCLAEGHHPFTTCVLHETFNVDEKGVKRRPHGLYSLEFDDVEYRCMRDQVWTFKKTLNDEA
jgi:hypothetical protein